MNVTILKPSGEFIARTEVAGIEELPVRLQEMIAAGTRIPLRTRVQAGERGWVITGFNPIQLREEAPRPAMSVAANPIIETQWRRQGSRGAARSQMMIGLCWCIGGVIVTIGSYMAAAGGATSGTYVVAWGAILFGGVRFLKGLAASRDR